MSRSLSGEKVRQGAIGEAAESDSQARTPQKEKELANSVSVQTESKNAEARGVPTGHSANMVCLHLIRITPPPLPRTATTHPSNDRAEAGDRVLFYLQSRALGCSRQRS